MRIPSAIVAATAVVALTITCAHAASEGDEACHALLKVKVADTKIEAAELIPSGIPPAAPPLPALALPVPAHCKVTGVISPTSDSRIRFEVWLPASDWNGKYQGVGNPGFAGNLNVGEVALAVQRGYASGTTDTGHGSEGTDVWAKDHPERIKDYGYRGLHLATVVAKQLVATFYGRKASRSYFAGCSNGGRQALMEAQRFPADYDGIIAGAPPVDWVADVVGSFGWDTQAMLNRPESTIPPKKNAAIAAAVNAQCDKLDGVEDGVIRDPRLCTFDPKVLRCSGEETDQCLTDGQIASLTAVYQGPHTKDGHRINPGFLPGGETSTVPGSGWDGWIFATPAQSTPPMYFLRSFMRDMMGGGSTWDYQSLDIDRDLPKGIATYGQILSPMDPDLSHFFARGGKLILWHGWSDAALPPLRTVQYYEDVRARMGAKADHSVRLFMVPGMQHCAFGPGSYMFNSTAANSPADPRTDMAAALEAWVDGGKPPNEIVAWRPADLMAALSFAPNPPAEKTSLLCAYPAVAVWDGHGDVKQAASYSCKAAPTPN